MKSQTLGDARSAEYMRGRRSLELNAGHPVIAALRARVGERGGGRRGVGAGRGWPRAPRAPAPAARPLPRPTTPFQTRTRRRPAPWWRPCTTLRP